MTLELLKIIFYKAFARVSDIELLAFTDFIEYHKVVLIPMKNARQWLITELIHFSPCTNSMKSQSNGSIVQSE